MVVTITEGRPILRGPGTPGLLPCFVYGTLRSGQGNYHWCQAAVRRETLNVRANGRLYFVSGHTGYPVAKLDENGIILGDVLWFDPVHPDFDAVVQMETGAGYECRDIEVLTEESERIDCMAFHYIWTPRGELIPDGDWIRAVGR